MGHGAIAQIEPCLVLYPIGEKHKMETCRIMLRFILIMYIGVYFKTVLANVFYLLAHVSTYLYIYIYKHVHVECAYNYTLSRHIHDVAMYAAFHFFPMWHQGIARQVASATTHAAWKVGLVIASLRLPDGTGFTLINRY